MYIRIHISKKGMAIPLKHVGLPKFSPPPSPFPRPPSLKSYYIPILLCACKHIRAKLC